MDGVGVGAFCVRFTIIIHSMEPKHTLVDVCGFRVLFPNPILEHLQTDPWLEKTMFEGLCDLVYPFDNTPVHKRDIGDDLSRVIYLIRMELRECEARRTPYDGMVPLIRSYGECHAALDTLLAIIDSQCGLPVDRRSASDSLGASWFWNI